MLNKKELQNTIFAQSDVIQESSEVFQVLGNECRLEMLIALVKAGELSSGEIGEITNCSPSVVSQAMAQMRRLRLVIPRRKGLNVYYTVNVSHALWGHIWTILKPYF